MKLLSLFMISLLSLFSSIATVDSGYKPGDKATDFKLKSVDGKMYSMSDYKDAKGFIVVFTCNTCPFAVKYEDRVNDLAKKYKSKGYVLLAINPNSPEAQPDDTFELMQAKAKSKRFAFPYLVDEGQKVNAYLVTKAAEQGDKEASRIMRETGEWLGIGLSTVINLLNPEVIIIGGGVSLAGDVLFNPMKEEISKRALKRILLN